MSEVEFRLGNGIAAFKAGDFDRAVSVIETYTRVNPASYDAFVYLGAAYAQQGRNDAAIGALKRASEIKPESPTIHYNLGQAYETAGVHREAWLEYKRALEIDPKYGLARGALVSLSHRLPKLLTPSIELAS